LCALEGLLDRATESFASLEEAIEFGIRTRPNLAILSPDERREVLRRHSASSRWPVDVEG